MKKFKDGEIFHNIIKAYPKVEFFANSGQVHYGRQAYPAAASNTPIESVSIFDIPNPFYAGPPSTIAPNIINGILAEDGSFLITEASDNLITES